MAEGAIATNREHEPAGSEIGTNSFFAQSWTPPDPPTGHGSHDYVFQLFALSETSAMTAPPGRSAFVDAITGKILAAGVLIGTYSREQELLTMTASGVPESVGA